MKRQPKAGVVSFAIKRQLHRIRNFELCLLLYFWALGSISMLNWSLYHETCNVSSLKYDRNSAETITRYSMMHALMLFGKLILFIFRRFSYKENEVVDPTLIRACQTPIRAVSSASLSLTSLTVSLRPFKDKFTSLRWPNRSARYASITTNSSL